MGPYRNLSPMLSAYRAVNATVAGTSAVNGASFDMRNSFGGPYTGIRYTCSLGTLTATQVTSLKVQGSNDGGSTWADIAGSQQGPANDGDSNKLLITEVYRPQFTLVRPVVVRGTANAVIDSVVGEAFNASGTPVTTQDATVSVPIASHGSNGTKAPQPYNLAPQPGVAGTA